jgi:hypothetical protein
MDADNLIKMVIALTSVLLGWTLAQVTATLKTWLHGRKIIKLLLEELRDLDRESTRLLHYHARNLQLYGAKGIDQSGTVGISNPIFSNYYKDALLYLNQNQRISFQMIHGLINSQNEFLKEYDDINRSVHKDHRENGLTESIVKGGDHLGELAKHGYSNCAMIKWHIDFHLNREKDPDLSIGNEDHKAYLKYLESVVKEMNKTIESGKTIPREKFEMIFDESHFSPSP